MKELEDLASFVGWKKAASALGIPRATVYRWRKGRGQEVPRAPPPWTLSDEQKRLVEEALSGSLCGPGGSRDLRHPSG